MKMNVPSVRLRSLTMADTTPSHISNQVLVTHKLHKAEQIEVRFGTIVLSHPLSLW